MDWFAERVLTWFDRHGRRNLPWQRDLSPYRVWVSEIMLQQTQVATVIPYYQRFVGRFPDVGSLAAAELDHVLHLWTGLGYYARARNLHRAAREVVARHGGRLPDDVDALMQLPGIGRSTAAAVAAIAFGRRAAILDGNVKRVLARFHAVGGSPGERSTLAVLWKHAEAHTPEARIGEYTQAIMDLGATLCLRASPRCSECPVESRCTALARGAVQRYPARRQKRHKPTRASRMFLLSDPDGHCLLEQRPPSGLWGGLWTPPERGADTTAEAVCRELGIPVEQVASSRTGARFRHTFTHFHLDVEPVYVQLARRNVVIADRPDLCWYARNADSTRPTLGLSAPAARLLAAFD